MTEKLTVLSIADENPDMTRTLAQARLAAEDAGARLWVVGFREPGDEDASYEPRLRGTVGRVLDGFEDFEITIVHQSDIAGWVKEQCDAGKIDLIVKTGHRTETVFYSPTDWHLIRNVKTPLLLLAQGRQPKKLNTILATVDLENNDKEQQELDHKVMRIAKRLADDFGSTLHGAVCVATSRVLTDLDLVDIHKREKAHAPKVREIIARDYADCGIEEGNWHIHAGPPEDVIAHIAVGIHADLTVVGTVGRKKLRGLLLGNTVEKILKNVNGNLLIVKPD